MSWLRHLTRARQERPACLEAADPGPSAQVRGAPGIAALFDGLCRDGGHAVLDLGPAVEAHLAIYTGYARQVRFADLVEAPPHGDAWRAALSALRPPPRHRYDLVLAWDVLDRIWPEERPSLVERLAELTAPGARLHVLTGASGEVTGRDHRFTLVDLDHVREEIVGAPHRGHAPLLPAQVERLLRPFEVRRAFTLRSGMRAYVAVRAHAVTGG